MLPNFDYRILLALKRFGNDAQARTSIRKQNPEKEDFSRYAPATTHFDYSSMHMKTPKSCP